MFIMKEDPNSIASESFRTLRTNIEYSSFDNELKEIIVTSAEQGEGKTTVASNLAFSLAQDEKSVILIDCDLRRPSIHKRFNISNEKGISEILIGKTSLDEAKIKILESLHVITSGKLPPNPSEMMGSKNMKKLIDVLKKEYDYVIIDTPPILAVTDAQILSTRADGVILVVRAEKTKKDNVINAKKLLDKVNTKIVGIVLNAMEVKSKNYYYGEKKKSNSKRNKKERRKKQLKIK